MLKHPLPLFAVRSPLCSAPVLSLSAPRMPGMCPASVYFNKNQFVERFEETVVTLSVHVYFGVPVIFSVSPSRGPLSAEQTSSLLSSSLGISSVSAALPE